MKPLTTLSGIITLVVLLAPTLSISNAFPDTVCGLAGANSTMIENCINGYRQYQNMTTNSYQSMQNTLDHSREQIRHDQILQNVTEENQYKLSKPKLAQSMTHNDIESRAWYDSQMKENLYEMKVSMRIWQETDHNPQPQAATCPAWHVCGADNIPLNIAQIEEELKSQNQTISNYHKYNTTNVPDLKPEMQNNPSGVITMGEAITNWQQFATWFQQNQTKH